MLAWGALSFGAVYPWGYWPLMVGCALIGVGGLVSGSRLPGDGLLALLVASIALVGVIQLLPLPAPLLKQLTPSTDQVLLDYNVPYAIGVRETERVGGAAGHPRHPLSISPSDTRLGVGFVTALGLFLVGSVRIMSRVGAISAIRPLMALGLVVALCSFVQAAFFQDTVFGFWTPENDLARVAAPFINRNHLAGWMLMAVPLSLGFVAGSRVVIRRDNPTWQDRLLWLSTRDANELILASGVTFVMALSVMLSFSRAGTSCLVIAVLAFVTLGFQGRWGLTKKAAVFLYGAFLVLAVLTWVGVDRIGQRFAALPTDIGDRLGPWSDALGVFEDFPLAGTGIHTYSVAMLFYQNYESSFHFAQAHNDYLQLLAEGGVMLAVPTVALIGLLLLHVRRRFREGRDDDRTWWLRVGAVCGLGAIALQELVDFSLQIPGNAVLFCFTIAVAIHRPPTTRSR